MGVKPRPPRPQSEPICPHFHDTLAVRCVWCKTEAENAALRAEVKRLRATHKGSHAAELRVLRAIWEDVEDTLNEIAGRTSCESAAYDENTGCECESRAQHLASRALSRAAFRAAFPVKS